MTTHIDKRALERIRKGDFQIFAECHTDFYKSIFRLLLVKTESRELAEDLTSETFLNFVEYVLRGNEIRHVRGFLYRSARNALANHFRTAWREVPIEEEDDIESRNLGLDESIDRSMTAELLQESLKELKEEWQEVVFLRFIEECSYADIAKIRESSEGAVRVMVSRAVKELKKVLGHHAIIK